MKKCWILTNRIDYFNNYEDVNLGVFTTLEEAVKALKRFVKVSDCQWEQEEGEYSYVRLRKTKYRVGSDEFVYIQECVLDGIVQDVWRERTRPKEVVGNGKEEG